MSIDCLTLGPEERVSVLRELWDLWDWEVEGEGFVAGVAVQFSFIPSSGWTGGLLNDGNK